MASASVPNARSQAKRKAPDHPSYNEMVLSAIIDGDARKGTSLYAIKRNVKAQYNVADSASTDTNIKLALKRALAAGKLVTAKNHAGHFRMPSKQAAAGKVDKAGSADKAGKVKKPAGKSKTPARKQKAVKSVKKTPVKAKKIKASHKTPDKVRT